MSVNGVCPIMPVIDVCRVRHCFFIVLVIDVCHACPGCLSGLPSMNQVSVLFGYY